MVDQPIRGVSRPSHKVTASQAASLDMTRVGIDGANGIIEKFVAR